MAQTSTTPPVALRQYDGEVLRDNQLREVFGEVLLSSSYSPELNVGHLIALAIEEGWLRKASGESEQFVVRIP